MKYSDFLVEDTSEEVKEFINERSNDPVKLLRDNGFKISLVTKTSFGTQIDFAKKYESEEIENILKSYDIKIKNKSVFINEF